MNICKLYNDRCQTRKQHDGIPTAQYIVKNIESVLPDTLFYILIFD